MKIKLVDATLKDAKFVYDLRFSPEVNEVSITNKIPSFKRHIKWFNNNYKQYHIILSDKKQIGFIRKEAEGYIGIVLKKEVRDKGLGQEILKKTTGKAIILLNNTRSLHCFIKAGWNLKGFYLEKKE